MNRIRFVTIIGAIVNILLSMVKLIIGVLAHSFALVADGIHSISDLFTDATILIGSKYWDAPADSCHPYGHGRIETLISLLIGLILALVGITIGWKALSTIGEPDNYLPGWSALFVAFVSIVVKEILYRWSSKEGFKIHSTALVANAWHHRSDAISSIPVAVGILGSRLFPNLTYLDNIAALLVTAMLLKATWSIIWPSIKELLEARNDLELENRIIEYRELFPEIYEVHKVRTRRQGSSILIDFHMLVEPATTVEKAHNIAGKFKNFIITKEKRVLDILIHIEPYK